MFGANSVSGNPNQPSSGIFSKFYVTIPPIIAKPYGRSIEQGGLALPMGYEVTARLEYGDSVFYSPVRERISQDEKDQCRQEYIDMNKTHEPGRSEFKDPTTYVYPPSIDFFFSEINSGTYGWAIFTIAQKLQDIRNEINTTMTVNSGYRNPIRNAEVTTAKNSPHIYGEAADISVSSKENWKSLCYVAVKHGACIEPYYLTPTWIHMDWRKYSICGLSWPHGDEKMCD